MIPLWLQAGWWGLVAGSALVIGSAQAEVKDGIDFFLIREGYIQFQLIYYKPISI